MYSTTVVVLIALGLLYAAFAVPAVLQFLAYCERVAKATGRSGENQRTQNTDEGGNNAFQREQLRKLRSGEYKQMHDPALVAQGAVVARKLRLAWWLAIGLVAAVAAMQWWPR
jgi:hypothetical protein